MSITTTPGRRGRLVRHTIAGLALVATVGSLAACGEESTKAPSQSPTARAVAAATGSDRHLELKAAEVFRAEQRQAAAADRYTPTYAAAVFRAEQLQAAAGSDRHLVLRAGEISRKVQQSQQAVGSDRHLEQLARDIAKKES